MREVVLVLACFFGLLVPYVADAQDAARAGTYVIKDVVYHVDGLTWEWKLRNYLEIEIGRSFATKEETEAYVADRQQVLINNRIFEAEDSRVTARYEPRGDGRVAVILDVHVKDTVNFLVLPYFRYDSNTGLLLSIKARDRNFLGSMEQLRFDLDYTFTDTFQNEFGVTAGFALPFQAAGYDWKWTNRFEFNWHPDDDDYTADATTGLEIDVPIEGQIITFGAFQDYTIQERNEADRWYLSTGVKASTRYKTPVNLPVYGDLYFTPGVTFQQNWRPDEELSEDKRGLVMNLTQSLSAGRADWIGNFRRGLTASLANSLPYNLFKGKFDDAAELSADLEFFAPVGDWLGLSSRWTGFLRYETFGIKAESFPRDDAGNAMRGIVNDRLDGDLGLFFNFDFEFALWKSILPIRQIDFELHVGPFVDVGYVRPNADIGFQPKDWWVSGGLEVLVFPRIARAFAVRASLGFDLEAVFHDRKLNEPAFQDGAKRWEIYIGLERHY